MMTQNAFTGKLVRLAVFDPEKDAELMEQWNQDSEYLRLLDNSPARLYSSQSIQEFIEKGSDEMAYFTIRTMTDDRPIGNIDLSGFDWAAGNAWVGIGLGSRQDWGKGYGGDAMQILLRFAFEELNLHRINLSVFEYNPRAIRCYEKVGFRHEGRQREVLRRNG